MDEAGYSIFLITFFAVMNTITCFLGSYLISSIKWYPPGGGATLSQRRCNHWSHWAYTHIGMFLFVLGLVNLIRVGLICTHSPADSTFLEIIRVLRDLFASGLYIAIVVFIATLYKGHATVLKRHYEHHLECKLRGITPDKE